MKYFDQWILGIALFLLLIYALFLVVEIAKADECYSIPPVCSWDQKPVCVCVYEEGGSITTPAHCYYVCVDRK